MYGFLESSFNVRMLRANEHIKAVSAQGEHASILQVGAGTPLLLVERLSMTYADKPDGASPWLVFGPTSFHTGMNCIELIQVFCGAKECICLTYCPKSKFTRFKHCFIWFRIYRCPLLVFLKGFKPQGLGF